MLSIKGYVATFAKTQTDDDTHLNQGTRSPLRLGNAFAKILQPREIQRRPIAPIMWWPFISSIVVSFGRLFEHLHKRLTIGIRFSSHDFKRD